MKKNESVTSSQAALLKSATPKNKASLSSLSIFKKDPEPKTVKYVSKIVKKEEVRKIIQEKIEENSLLLLKIPEKPQLERVKKI